MDPLLTKARVDIEERMAIVPQELVDLITDGTLDVTVFDLVQQFGLTEEQKKLLENEIILVLLLFIPVEDFAPNIEESLEVGYEAAQSISNQVHSEIFELVEDILQTVSQGRKEVAAEKGLAALPKKMERREDLTKLAESLSTPKSQEVPPSAQMPVDTDVVEPIRTMEQDMNRVHGYGAYVQQQEEAATPATSIPKKEAAAPDAPTNFIPRKENP